MSISQRSGNNVVSTGRGPDASIMNIIVLGAGAIGTLYGARLSAAHEVTLVARRDHVERIRAEGLRISGLEENTYRVNAATEVSRIAPNTVIILTTKVTGTRAA